MLVAACRSRVSSSLTAASRSCVNTSIGPAAYPSSIYDVCKHNSIEYLSRTYNFTNILLTRCYDFVLVVFIFRCKFSLSCFVYFNDIQLHNSDAGAIFIIHIICQLNEVL